MKKYPLLTLFLLFTLFLYLILFPVSSISSARSGLTLWYRSIVPVLFPFMFLCRLMINFHIIQYIPRFLTKPLRVLLGCSHEGALSVIIGYLCGFPTGACFASYLYCAGRISKSESRFLIPFVNNLSPGFLTSYLAVEQLKTSTLRLPILSITLGSSFLYGIIVSCFYRVYPAHQIHQNPTKTTNPTQNIQTHSSDNVFALIDDALSVSIHNTLKLGGYIVFFSILSDAVSLLPISHPAILLGASSIEITKGLYMIANWKFPIKTQVILSVALSSFGGWSAAFQTAGVTRMTGREFLQYIKSRVIITLLSILLSLLFL